VPKSKPSPPKSRIPSTACGGIFDYDGAQARLAELQRESEDPALWERPERAQAILREKTRVEDKLKRTDGLQRSFDDAVTLIELGEAEEDAGVVAEAEAALAGLQRDIARAELTTLLSGEADGNDCYLEVHAGAGGTEAQDWAEMLLRMYTRWAERRRFKVNWIEESPGEEAGLKSATLQIIGTDAYGWLKTEAGVHRLVRISPFDSNARRHTSFASVGAYPVIDESIEVEILDKDLRVDTYRPGSSSSARTTAPSTATGRWRCRC
jgi:peptide chain release factor 2